MSWSCLVWDGVRSELPVLTLNVYNGFNPIQTGIFWDPGGGGGVDSTPTS